MTEHHIDTRGIIKKAKDAGFDTAAALNLKITEKTIAEWKTFVRDESVLKRLILDPRDILPDVQSLIMLAYPYRTYTGYAEGTGWVSGYYTASNKSYNAAQALAEDLRKSGIGAINAYKLPLKPLARAAGLGRYGRNGIIVRKGSHIVLSAILVNIDIELPAVNTPVPDCGKCGICEKNCPSGCLKDGYVQEDRCLRTYMTSSVNIPADDIKSLMGERLLGCDECLNACPGLVQEKVPEEFNEIFRWDALINKVIYKKNRDIIISLIGSNYADAVHKSAMRRCSDFQELGVI